MNRGAVIARLAEQAAADQALRRAHVALEAAIEGLIVATGSTAETVLVLTRHASQLRDAEALVRPQIGPASRRTPPEAASRPSKGP